MCIYDIACACTPVRHMYMYKYQDQQHYTRSDALHWDLLVENVFAYMRMSTLSLCLSLTYTYREGPLSPRVKPWFAYLSMCSAIICRCSCDGSKTCVCACIYVYYSYVHVMLARVYTCIFSFTYTNIYTPHILATWSGYLCMCSKTTCTCS
jgi:hypothetical protein